MALSMGPRHPLVSLRHNAVGCRLENATTGLIGLNIKHAHQAAAKPYITLSQICACPSQVQLAQRFEKFWGRKAERHLCVTQAMQAGSPLPAFLRKSGEIIHRSPVHVSDLELLKAVKVMTVL